MNSWGYELERSRRRAARRRLVMRVLAWVALFVVLFVGWFGLFYLTAKLFGLLP